MISAQGEPQNADAIVAKIKQIVEEVRGGMLPDAFLAAARDGDYERLIGVLDPDVVVRSDGGIARPELVSMTRGARNVAEQAMTFRRFAEAATRVLVNGVPGGVAWAPDGTPFAVLAMTVRGGKVVAIDVLADPERLRDLDLDEVAG